MNPPYFKPHIYLKNGKWTVSYGPYNRAAAKAINYVIIRNINRQAYGLML